MKARPMSMADSRRAYEVAIARFKAYPACSICGRPMICGQTGAHGACRR